MDTEVLTFADRLREIAAAHGWSLEILANMTGYKSRTSVSRVLQERSSHKTQACNYPVNSQNKSYGGG